MRNKIRPEALELRVLRETKRNAFRNMDIKEQVNMYSLSENSGTKNT